MKTRMILIAVAAFVCGSCDIPRLEYGKELLTEPAEVIDVCFVPKGHGSDLAVGYSMAGKGGLTLTPIDVTIPARYAVVFKCQHGKFIIDGERGEKLYQTLQRGDKVDIKYQEKFEVTKESTKLVGLHFIDAVKE